METAGSARRPISRATILLLTALSLAPVLPVRAGDHLAATDLLGRSSAPVSQALEFPADPRHWVLAPSRPLWLVFAGVLALLALTLLFIVAGRLEGDRSKSVADLAVPPGDENRSVSYFAAQSRAAASLWQRIRRGLRGPQPRGRMISASSDGIVYRECLGRAHGDHATAVLERFHPGIALSPRADRLASASPHRASASMNGQADGLPAASPDGDV